MNIELGADEQEVILTAKILNKKPAFLNVFIKNTGKNSELRGHIFVENFDQLNLDIKAGHFAENTGILVHTKLIAHKDTYSKLSGIAEIAGNCRECTSDIGFSAIADDTAKIEFLPAQRIKSEPKSAEHSATIYRLLPAQIEFLRNSGLSTLEIRDVSFEAFKKDFSLF